MTGPARRIVLADNIVARLREREELAYRELFDSTWRSLVAIAAGIVQSLDVAEDVVQGVIFRIWRLGPQLDPNVDLVPYVIAAVRNAALSRLRSEERLRHRDDRMAAGQSGDIDDADQADAKLEWQDQINELRRVVATLTEHQRTAFTLRYEQGMTNAEIARVLEISVKGAEQLTARLKKLLRERFRAD